MKRFILILFIYIAAALSASSQTASDAPELTRLLNEFLAGAGRNDAEIHDRFWADDLIYTRSSGSRTNKPDLMKGVRSAPAAKPTDPVTIYSAEEIKIQQYGKTAIVAFRLVGTTSRADGTKSVSNHLNTGTFIKRNGKWQVVAWQATAVPSASSGQAPQNTSPAVPPKTATDTSNRTYLKVSAEVATTSTAVEQRFMWTRNIVLRQRLEFPEGPSIFAGRPARRSCVR